MAVKDHPGYPVKAKELGMDKIAVWWGLSKSSKKKSVIMRGAMGHPDVLEAMTK